MKKNRMISYIILTGFVLLLSVAQLLFASDVYISDYENRNLEIINNGETVHNIALFENEWRIFKIDIPDEARNLVISIDGQSKAGPADADLYTKHGAIPTFTSFDCRPWMKGSRETCTISDPVSGEMMIGIHAWYAFQDVQLTVKYEGTVPTPAPSSTPSPDLFCDPSLVLTSGSGQHQWGSSYCNWKSQSRGVRFEQKIILKQMAPNSFHVQQFSMSGASGGYIGLQTHGIKSDNTLNTNVRFSIWNTIAASGSDCRTFGGEGTGYTCVINPYELNLDTLYKIRVKRLTGDSYGTWWQGSVINLSNNIESVIGKIKVPHSTSEKTFGSGLNFTEYFGPKVIDCKSVPQSIVQWSLPEIYNEQNQKTYDLFSHFSKANPNKPCSEAGVEAHGEKVFVENEQFFRMTNGSIVICQ